MAASRWLLVVPSLALGILSTLQAQNAEPAVGSNRVQLQLNSDEADVVLAILDKRASGAVVADADWQRLFATEPYSRLKRREAAMHREFSDEDFRTFVVSPELIGKARVLHHTLDTWKQADLHASAMRALTYLPEQAVIRAKVFPVIKPKTNSFVFETESDPTIFLYLDPEESAAKFENTVAHELHHIGYSSIASLSETRQKDVPVNAKSAVQWMGAFGEGFAMLAAAGGPDIDPHAASSPEAHARWDHDMANFNQDLGTLQQFFLDTVDGKFPTQDAVNEKASTFFGDAQGPWYTVGYRMAVVVEKRFGRAVLIECMLDPRELLARYNQAAEEINRSAPGSLALWTPDLLKKLGAGAAGGKS